MMPAGAKRVCVHKDPADAAWGKLRDTEEPKYALHQFPFYSSWEGGGIDG